MKRKAEKPEIEIKACFFQLLGQEVTDLINDLQPIKLGEDMFGEIEIVGQKEEIIESAEQFQKLNEMAKSNRATKSTFKNDMSSRTHSVVRITFTNTKHKTISAGQLLIFDLAGSENMGDSKYHDKNTLAETKEINLSLMSLAECTRNRALSAVNPDKSYHIPYRQSKLTHILKDAFELQSRK
jgi:hypothetical protein